jgi:hypothetical protein
MTYSFKYILLIFFNIVLFTPFLIASAVLAKHNTHNHKSLEYIGIGFLFTNDYFGDSQDRWKTGSHVSSRIFAPNWKGELPSYFGELIELRFHSEIVSPGNLNANTKSIDRPYAGHLSLGIHSHFQKYGLSLSSGFDYSIIGIQTGLLNFHRSAHKSLRQGPISEHVANSQLPNNSIFGLVLEAGKDFSPIVNNTVRPFIELKKGPENILRAGLDYYSGIGLNKDLFIRAPVTGHRYRALRSNEIGMAWTVGADLSYIESSSFLPKPDFKSHPNRVRVRTGFHWTTPRTTGFVGVTKLGPEFVGQNEDQITGSISLKYHFR